MSDLDAWLETVPAEWRLGCARPLFQAAFDAHHSPGRHYHAWSHVEDCVEKLRTFPVGNPRTVFIALLFHDAVYVAGRADNEERSAELATRELSAHADLTREEVTEVERMILATEHHRVEDGQGDVGAMLDIDMSILGAADATYWKYAREVMREWVPSVTSEARFRIGRLEFLRKILAAPRIFSTPEGERRWAQPARRNIASEIESLSRGQGWFERTVGWFVSKR